MLPEVDIGFGEHSIESPEKIALKVPVPKYEVKVAIDN